MRRLGSGLIGGWGLGRLGLLGCLGLLGFFVCHMVAHGAAYCGTCEAMMAGDVTGDAADGSTCDAAGLGCQRRGQQRAQG